MLVKIEEIKDPGLHLREKVTESFMRETLGDAGSDGSFIAEGGFDYQASLNRVGESVLLRGQFAFDVKTVCKRCLADVNLNVPVNFTLNLVPDPTHGAGSGGEGEDDEKGPLAGSFRLEEADEETFDGKTIDLDPILREQVLLALPMNVECREDCKGLCSQCGKNQNETACGCEAKRVDPRMAALKDIKLN